MLAKTIKKAAMINIFGSKLCLLYIYYPVSIDNTQHYIQDIVYPIIQECNQNFVKGVSLSASKKSQKNDALRRKWLSFLTSDLIMTLFVNFWFCNFNLKPLSRNHPCYGASCLTILDAPWGIDNN